MENSALQEGTKTEAATMSEYKNSENGATNMEYPTIAGTAPTLQVHTSGPCDPVYDPTSIGYSDFSDRFSVGYQRMGQTITLTSHKIQFGCQHGRGHSSAPYYRPRFEDPRYRQHYHVGHGKTWTDTSMEQTLQPIHKPHNRGRTTYSDEQIAELEGVFNSNPYPTAQTRQQLAYKIDVPEGKVKIWFQNRRARAKKVKLSCGWRIPHNESRIIEDHNNQNNNNTKSDYRKQISMNSYAPPINTLLPLPTKPAINANKWTEAGCIHPWKTQSQNNDLRFNEQSCRMREQSACALVNYPFSSDQSDKNTKMWNWAGAYSSQCCPDVYRPSYDQEEQERRRNLSTAWNPQQILKNQPNLIPKTSRAGLEDSVNNEGDVNQPTSSLTASNLKDNEDAAASDSVKISTSSTSCSNVSTHSLSVCSSNPEKRSPTCNSEHKSPPPVRRLIFPFHTLTDVKTSIPDTGMIYYPPFASKSSVVPENFYHSYPPKTHPIQSTTYLNLQGINLSDNYQPQSVMSANELYPINISQFRVDPSAYPQIQRAVGEKRGLPYYSSNTCHIPEVREQGIVKYENGIEQNTSFRSYYEDDGETTDDAVDDVGGMDEMNMDESGLVNKSSQSYSARNAMQYPTTCWNDRTSSNILMKAMECTGERSDINVKPINDVNHGLLTSLTNGVLPVREPAGVWANQIVGGIYPPESASLVG